MPKTKVQAFLKEFPWIQDMLDGYRTRKINPISQVYVSMVEPSLWEYYPKEVFIPGDLFFDSRHYQELMFLLDENQKVIMYEKKTELRRKYILFGPRAVKSQICPAVVMDPKFSFGSFILKNFGGDAQPKIDIIRFILSYYSEAKAVIIYKLPKGISLSALMQEHEETERKKIRDQINF